MKCSLLILLEGSLRGKLCSAMLVIGLSRLGRKGLMSSGMFGSCAIRFWVVSAW